MGQRDLDYAAQSQKVDSFEHGRQNKVHKRELFGYHRGNKNYFANSNGILVCCILDNV